MTLAQAPLLVDGATHSAQTFRMMIRDLSRGGEGITEGADLKVRPLPTPGPGVEVGNGSGVIRGRANAWQGSYTAYNIGTATVPVAPTGATPRSDLLVLRVTDPEYEGGLDPAKDTINTFEVIPNVSPAATKVPDGVTGIALARLDLPASTATVTAAMITDLRSVANPRSEAHIFTASPTSDDNYKGTGYKWAVWPRIARWQVAVPHWAVRARVKMTLAGIQLIGGTIYGGTAFQLGPVVGQSVVIDSAWPGGDYSERLHLISADTLAIPESLRGTTQWLEHRVARADGVNGYLQADIATTAIGEVAFEEGPM